MSKQEKLLVDEINQYRQQLGKTQSKQRQYQLWQHIRKLEKELKIYRNYRSKLC